MFEMSFNLFDEGKLIRSAVNTSLNKEIVTEDLSNGKKSFKTSEVGDFLVREILNS